MALDPRNSSIVFTGGASPNAEMAVSRTMDGGSSWSRYILSSVANGFTNSLAIDPNNSNVVYAGGSENFNAALYKTTNSGTTWTEYTTGLTGTVYSLSIDPTNSNIVYAGTADGVHKSTNGGMSWENVGCYGVRSVVVDPARPMTIYAGTSIGVYISTNGGVDWAETNQGIPTRNILCVAKTATGKVYAGTEGYSIYEWRATGISEETKSSRLEINSMSIRPNPASSTAQILFSLTHSQNIEIDLYDRCGRIVRNLYHGWKDKGNCRISFDVSSLPSGVYFLKLTAGLRTSYKNLIIVK